MTPWVSYLRAQGGPLGSAGPLGGTLIWGYRSVRLLSPLPSFSSDSVLADRFFKSSESIEDDFWNNPCFLLTKRGTGSDIWVLIVLASPASLASLDARLPSAEMRTEPKGWTTWGLPEQVEDFLTGVSGADRLPCPGTGSMMTSENVLAVISSLDEDDEANFLFAPGDEEEEEGNCLS